MPSTERLVVTMNILHEIAQRTMERVEAQKKAFPLERIKEMVCHYTSSDPLPQSTPAGSGCCKSDADSGFAFENALRSDDIAFICEIKKASPSKGVIAKDFPYLDIARDYEAAGAASISVLTEPYYFKGSDRYLREIADAVSIPLLRKDFTVDSYMIYEAKLLGASCVLLICALLEQDALEEYIATAHNLGLSALVEIHDEREMDMALSASARIIGVNNRNLKTFEVDMTLSERLRALAPPDVLFVSESGISQSEDIARLRRIGVDGVLIGETLMRAPDKKAALAELRGKELQRSESSVAELRGMR